MYQLTQIENGIRIATESIPWVRSITIGAWFRTGSKNEIPTNNGISHLIEHLLFKGTKKRTARQIAESMDAIGGQLNAFTSKEYTCYYAQILDQHLPLAVEILGDLIQNALLTYEDLVKEKGVILEEIKLYEDTPDDIVHDLFTAVLFGEHPLGRTVLGTAASVEAISRDDILNYLEQYYTPDRLVIAAAGNLQHEAVVELVRQVFGRMQGGAQKQNGFPLPPVQDNLVRSKDTEQVHLIVGMRGLAHDDPQKFPLLVYNTIMGGGMSSRLFQELREERGLVYSTYSYHLAYEEAGLFGAYAGTSKENARHAAELIRSEYQHLADVPVSAEELFRAKEQLKGSIVLSLESTSNRMGRIAKAELFQDSSYTPDELIARIEAVTIEDVQAVGQRLNKEELRLAAIGTTQDFAEIIS